MKTALRLFGLIAVVAVIGLSMACDTGNSPKEDIEWEPLVFAGTGDNGEELRIEIHRTNPLGRTVVTPQDGDYYVIYLGDVVVSSGTVKVSNSQGGNSQGGNSQGGNSQGGNSQGGNSQGGSINLTFTPSAEYGGSANEFTATLATTPAGSTGSAAEANETLTITSDITYVVEGESKTMKQEDIPVTQKGSNDNSQGNNNNQGEDNNNQGGNNQGGNNQGGNSQGGNSQGGNSQGGSSSDRVYLRAERWTDSTNGNSGANWNTGGSLLLRYYFSGMLAPDTRYVVTIGGTLDKRLEELMVMFYRDDWKSIGDWGTAVSNAKDIPAGRFSVQMEFKTTGDPIPAGSIYVQLANNKGAVTDNIADGTLMATISNFTMSITAAGGTAANPFLVRNLADLQKVGTGTDGWVLDAHYRQTADINTASVANWTPIGTNSSFTGGYDGGNYTISSLRINTTAERQGLFATIGNGGVVKNLKLTTVSITGGGCTGGVAGWNERGTIQNCSVSGSITGNGELGVGGIVGWSNGTVKDCTTAGTVTGLLNDVGHSGSAGGVAGENLGLVENCTSSANVIGCLAGPTGGVVGQNYGGIMKNCTASGNVSGGEAFTGGVVGSNNGSDNTVLVLNCKATGNVTGINDVGGVAGGSGGMLKDCSATGTVTGSGDAIGGVAGSNNGTIENCTASGNVTGNFDVGGVVGRTWNGEPTDESTVVNCTASGNVTGVGGVGGVIGGNCAGGTVKDCKSTGDVTCSDYGAGGVAGANDGTIENCTASGKVTGYDVAGGVVGNNGGTVKDCTAKGNVSGDIHVGGVVGHNSGTVKNCGATGNVTSVDTVGGVAGSNYYGGTVQGCTASGNVTGSGIHVGGVVGDCGEGGVGSNGGMVKDCTATGNVTGVDHVGGVVGNNFDTLTENCTASGNVSGNENVGGVVGWNWGGGTVKGCSALNNSVTTTNASDATLGRVVGSDDGNGTTLSNNKANGSMTITYDSGTPYTPTNDPDGKDGGTI